MSTTPNLLYTHSIDTPLGPMIAIANEQALYFLEFHEQQNQERKLKQLRTKTRSTIIPGETDPIRSIKRELVEYFQGTLKQFRTPVCFVGSPFQQHAWHTLTGITYGQTNSYKQEAIKIGKPSASRAVANANGANKLAIIVPCHRIINSNGKLGGYAGGLERKQWLIDHEKRNT